ncbi:Zn-ribbon domain-containing OB-fold protein [Pseudonocardia pini]|uniref:Zn-ribbon domain-containing OB-fold protein n=1 Tax=Pseudonocardia pini TaxID=2758030 RepID=UPI0015F0AE5E|nr:OB-fold domain-containing protein [Pseudonocardia pini]
MIPHADADSRAFWDRLERHELCAQRCDDCGLLRFPAAPLCPWCRGEQADWEALSGRGVLRSWTVTHRVAHPGFADRVPYVSVLVELADQPGLLLYGLLDPRTEPAGQLPVRVEFVDEGDRTTVRWRKDVR